MLRIRGNPGPHVSRTGLVYNPETKIYRRETEYAGSVAGISGLAAVFANNKQDHRLHHEDGIARVTLYSQELGYPTPDRYEIQWEMEQREIWSHPTIAQAAFDFDTALDDLPDGEDGDTFRKKAEDSVNGKMDETAAGDPVSGAVFQRVVAALRRGISGWEQEYISLRRTRVVPPEMASPCNIYAASLIYTTAQLQLPPDVDFVVPSDSEIAGFPEPDPANFLWGWRRRPSTCVIQGDSTEQTSEFLLASWFLVPYAAATSNADW